MHWLVIKGQSYYGPFASKDKAALWGEKMFGPYTGKGWRIDELWPPSRVSK